MARPGRFSKAGARAIRVLLALCAAASLVGPQASAADDRYRAGDRPTPSRLPVPRWVSLKFNDVNARAGPGDDYPAVWTYHAKGLPVQVIAETREWRKVCDPDGGSAWIHRRTTVGVRTVFHRGAALLPLRASPKDTARVRALLAVRGIARLDKCEQGWCLVEAGKGKGWARAASLWGLATQRVCR
jgi:SH3-like domain-containing protein